jgi:shikimate 5-dehydrogenase
MNPIPVGSVALAEDGSWLRDGAVWEASTPFFADLGGTSEGLTLLRLTAAGLQARGLTQLCLSVQASPGSLTALKSSRGAAALGGFHVAVPLRLEAAALCERLTLAAQATGAVDTVRVQGGRWIGNDSGEVTMHSLLQECWSEAELPSAVTVLGCGPEARSATRALSAWGVETLTVCGATPSARQEFRTWLEEGENTGGGATRVTVAELTTDIERGSPRQSSLWISTLPAEMDLHPYLPLTAGNAACLLVDSQRRTPRELLVPLGFRYIDGGPLLLLRAGLAFTWWFEPPVPWQVLRQALETA